MPSDDKLERELESRRKMANSVSKELSNLGYDTVVEETFTLDSHAVLTWEKAFSERTPLTEVFDSYLADTDHAILARQTVVGLLWYEFSKFSVWYLCQSAALLKDNLKRHFIIQYAFEELGMRDHRGIHCDLFKSAAIQSGVDEGQYQKLGRHPELSSILESFRQTLLNYKDDAEILGLNLGMEFPAKENIDAVQRSLSADSDIGELVAKSQFFRIHNVIETEHIRLGIANFLRFCGNEDQKERFIRGFDYGIGFWREFWGLARRLSLQLNEEMMKK